MNRGNNVIVGGQYKLPPYEDEESYTLIAQTCAPNLSDAAVLLQLLGCSESIPSGLGSLIRIQHGLLLR